MRVVDIEGPRAPVEGLSSEEARTLLRRYGRNEFAPRKRRDSAFAFAARLVADPMVLLLAVAAATYVWLGDRFDAIVVSVALIPIFLVNAVLEQRADAALERLRDLASPLAEALRDGVFVRIKAADVVPGDTLRLSEGDIVAADGIVRPGSRLFVDESALTGESLPVEKAAPLEGTCDPIFAGTKIVAGHGTTRVERTGLATEYGRIGGLLGERDAPSSPIQRAIRRLVMQIGAGVLVVCAAVAISEVLHGLSWPVAIIAAVSLAMAAVPEELPMVYTLYLALGAWRLARRHALVRHLGSVETLGTTQTICVDKTGTLTLGHLELREVVTFDDRPRGDVIVAARRAGDERAVDPLDAAIAAEAERSQLATDLGAVDYDEPFDARRKYAATVRSTATGRVASVKGALDAVLTLARTPDAQREIIVRRHDDLAARGMRVIAVADGIVGTDTAESARWDVRTIGLLAFADPLRPQIPQYLRECREAGIAVVMITGDHASTARAIATDAGFASDELGVVTGPELAAMSEAALAERVVRVRIFAQIRPEQKLRIVEALRAAGRVVAMTGDGTNDALALREADIGVAMGLRGTEVAREAADLVLLDDEFATIVGAIREGRRIFENLQHAFRYLVAFHAPLLVSAFALPIFGAPIFLLPIHLVWLELVVHPTSSLVFESDPGDERMMHRPPRRATGGLLSARDWYAVGIVGTTLALAVVAVYVIFLEHGFPVDVARSAAMTAMIVGQTALVLAELAAAEPLWTIRGTRTLAIVLPLGPLSLLATLYVPVLARAMNLAPLAPEALAFAAAVGALAVFVFELRKVRFRERVA